MREEDDVKKEVTRATERDREKSSGHAERRDAKFSGMLRAKGKERR